MNDLQMPYGRASADQPRRRAAQARLDPRQGADQHGLRGNARADARAEPNTVCEEAACPNIGECWTKKHATVMILGDICTRACAFCNVKTGMPRAVDRGWSRAMSPRRPRELGLKHIVITSVDRDDLPDGGAQPVCQGDRGAAAHDASTTIEILTPDFRNKMAAAVEAIVAARPRCV